MNITPEIIVKGIMLGAVLFSFARYIYYRGKLDGFREASRILEECFMKDHKKNTP